MSEKTTWKRVSEALSLVKYCHMCRIESHGTSIGFPDLNVCIGGVETCVELKSTTSRKGGFFMRPSQVMWHHKRALCGGQSWILAHVQIPTEKERFLLIKGKWAQDLKKTEKDIDAWESSAYRVWIDKLNGEELAYFLRGGLHVNEKEHG